MRQIDEKQALEMFDEMLDECFDRFKLGSLEYCASNVFKAVDEIAYRQEFLNWLDSENLELL